jgi:membrane protein DedA with SNARE-associated domain
MNWVGAIVGALLTVLLQMVFAANISGSPRLDGTLMIATLVIFAAVMLGTTVALFRRFRPPK